MTETNEIIIYQGEDGHTHIDVKFTDKTVWLSQQQLCDLYQTSKANVSEHIKHIFEDGELDVESVVRNFRTTAADGKSYNVTFYNLDMIISLGYRIRSKIATHFRCFRFESSLPWSEPISIQSSLLTQRLKPKDKYTAIFRLQTWE